MKHIEKFLQKKISSEKLAIQGFDFNKLVELIKQYEDDKSKDFESVVRPVIKYLCENYHPHVTIIVTPTNAELLEGQQATGNVTDYLVD